MNKIKNRWLWPALVALFLLSAGVAAFNPVHAQGELVAALSTSSSDPTVGDVIPLTLSVTHPAGWRVIFPTLEKQWGDFEVRSQSVPEIVSNPDGTQTTTQEIGVARMRPGEAQTPALTLSVANDQGGLSSVEVSPLPVSVRSVLVAGDMNLREIKPQAALVTEGRPYWPLVTAGLLGIAAIAIYVVQRWRQRQRVDRRTLRQRALDSLAALNAQNPGTPAEIQAHCALLADILRDYLASTTDLPARDLTTRELALRFNHQDVPTAWVAQVIGVLQACDSVKFAHEELDVASLQTLLSTVRQLVEQYPPQPQPKPRRLGRKKTVEVMA